VGFTDIEVIPIGELDLMAPNLRRQGRPVESGVGPQPPVVESGPSSAGPPRQ
jgi:hypothetical protein